MAPPKDTHLSFSSYGNLHENISTRAFLTKTGLR